jgi:Tol biopolymer transport system component
VVRRAPVGYDIHTINPDGTDDRTLVTTAGGAAFFPEAMWSPDGRRLVYERGGAIWTVRGDGSDERKVAGGASERDYSPAWSPDGTEIIYTRRTNANGGLTDIYAVGADGGDKRPLFQAPVCTRTIGYCSTRAAWSSSGRIAVLSDRDGATELWAFDPDGSGALKLTSAPGIYPSFDWSPDGARLVFSHITPNGGNPPGVLSQVEIFTVAADGSQMTRIGAIDNLSNALNLPPGASVWSPDNTRIAFTGGTAPLPLSPVSIISLDVFTMNTDGSDVTRVTADGLSAVLDWQPLPVAPGSPGRATPVHAADPKLVISRRALVLSRRGVVRLRLKCARGGIGGVCTGTLRLASARRVTCSPSAPARKVRLARQEFRIAAGRGGVLRLRLARRSRQLAACHRHLRVRATATMPRPAGGVLTVRRTLLLRRR